MREKFKSSINFIATGQFHLSGQHGWVGGRRAGALFFALHRDYFVVTRNFTAIYLDFVPSLSFTVTRNSLPSTRTGKKQGTATQTAPNQTAGPLAHIFESVRLKPSHHVNKVLS